MAGTVGSAQVRAEALVAALADRGIPRDRMVAVGHGEDRPIITNEGCDLSERVDVRRLE